MPYADAAKQAEYQREWIAQRRTDWLADKSCIRCGSTEDLEIDHIDPLKKISHRIWSWSASRREAELAKCQVLCRPHHEEKTMLADETRKCGDLNGRAKVTSADVEAIRISGLSLRVLAVQYGISKSQAGRIRRYENWDELPSKAPSSMG